MVWRSIRLEGGNLMKPRLSVLLFIASLLLVLGTIAAACGDDDGDESDEDAIRNVVQEQTAALNDRDFDRLAELTTVNWETLELQFLIDNPDFRYEILEILSVMVAGDKATVMITHGGTFPGMDTLFLNREDGRWLVDRVADGL